MQMVVNSAELFLNNHPLYLNDNDCKLDKRIVSFKNFMSRHGLDPIVDLYEVPSRYTSHRKKYSYVPETHRSNIRSIVSFFCDLHKNNLSLQNFEECNIVFHHGELKFRGLKLVQRLNDADKGKDLTLLSNAIVNFFGNYNIPTSIADLLDYIQNYRY